MILNIKELNHNSDIASGSLNGKQVLAKAIPFITKSSGPQLLLLDFSGISVATCSFLRESVLGIRNYCHSANTNFYPIVSNPNNDVYEELQTLLDSVSDAFLSCSLNKGQISNIQLIGSLEEKQKMTYQAVLEIGDSEAGELLQKFQTEGIGITGWNNRLASLAAKGLLMEIKKGRRKIYRPLVEGVAY